MGKFFVPCVVLMNLWGTGVGFAGGVGAGGGSSAYPLAGTSWEVVGYNNGSQAVVSVLRGTRITAVFGDDGRVTGNGGCNRYFASYEVAAESISIGMPATTRMYCHEPEGIMEQEMRYLDALQRAATFRFDGEELVLLTAEGALAVSLSPDQPAADPLNASYTLDGKRVRLRRGRAEADLAPGSASRLEISVFGDPAAGDLDGDGEDDAALILVQNAGGSGTFYYVAAARNLQGGYVGSNAVLLGDRIVPQDIAIRDGFGDRPLS